jgi:hypothetical protein
MKRRLIFASALFAIAVTLSPLKASAVQSPVGCNSNRLNLSIGKDRTTVQQGDVITYTITASNLDQSPLLACDIDGATAIVTLPASDGTPTGTVVTLGNNLSFPAGTGVLVLGTATYTVNVNAGITDIVAEARINGVLHDAPVDHAAEIIKTIGTAVVSAPPSGGSGGSSDAPGLPNAGAPIGQ